MENEFVRVATTSERLKIAMELRQKKQADLVRLTGLDKGAISHYLSGSYEPKDKAILKLAKALNVAEMWLWGYDVPVELEKEEQEDKEISDAKVDITKRLRKDKVFFEAVCLLNQLNPEQLAKITGIMELFCKDSTNEIK